MELANHLIVCTNIPFISIQPQSLLLQFKFFSTKCIEFMLPCFFSLMTMSKIRFHSSVAARILGPRAKVCAEASTSPAVILFLCPSIMLESVVSFLFLAWASRSILFCASSCLQKLLILPTIVTAKPIWRLTHHQEGERQ